MTRRKKTKRWMGCRFGSPSATSRSPLGANVMATGSRQSVIRVSRRSPFRPRRRTTLAAVSHSHRACFGVALIALRPGFGQGTHAMAHVGGGHDDDPPAHWVCAKSFTAIDCKRGRFFVLVTVDLQAVATLAPGKRCRLAVRV